MIYVSLLLIGGTEPALSQAQPAGAKPAGRDIEVMKSIISTTLSYANPDLGGRRHYVVEWDSTPVEGFYLKGQGAVFTIRVPSSPTFDLSRLEGIESRIARVESGRNRDLMRAQLELLQAQLEESAARAEFMAQQEAKLVHLAPLPPEPPAPPVGEEAELSEREVSDRVAAMQQRLTEIRQKQQQAQAEAEAQRAKLEESLIDVLARHGDALTEVGPDEHINMVLLGSAGPTPFAEESSGGQSVRILSAKVSDVRDLKAGRIDRAQFESRVQKY